MEIKTGDNERQQTDSEEGETRLAHPTQVREAEPSLYY